MTRCKTLTVLGTTISLAVLLTLGLHLGSTEGAVPDRARGMRTVTDQAGREVELPEKVTRVDTSYRIATEIIIALGAGDKLIGVGLSSGSQEEFYSEFVPDFSSKTVTGSSGGSNAEQIAALKPDVALVSLTKGTGIAKIDQLESAGIKAVAIKCESPDELIEGVRLIGSIVGAEEKAEEYVSYYRDTCDLVRERLADLPDSQRVPVYLSGSGGILSSCGSRMYQSALIEMAGGRNVAASIPAGGWADVSPEQLLAWNPSVILAVQYGHGMSPCPATPRDIMGDSRFSTMDAVKEGRVYMFPSNVSAWDYPSMQSVLGLLWIAKTLHPDRFEDISMTEAADDFYLRFFGKSFQEIGGSL